MEQNLYTFGISAINPPQSYRAHIARSRRLASKRVVAYHLSKLHVFRDVCMEDLVILVNHCPIVHCKAESNVLSQGDEANWAMLLVEGRLRVVVDAEKVNRKVGEIFPGEVFGEQGLFFNKFLRSANVIASENSVCLRMSPKLMQLLRGNKAMTVLEKQLIATMARRIRNSNLEVKKNWSKKNKHQNVPENTGGFSSFVQSVRTFFGGAK